MKELYNQLAAIQCLKGQCLLLEINIKELDRLESKLMQRILKKLFKKV